MRTLLIAIFVNLSLFCNAQHLLFNDISIDGEIGNFSNSLLDKGFTKWDKNADSEIEKWFVGKYLSYDAILVANATPISKTAYSLQIILEFDDNLELNVAEQHLKEKLKSDYRAKNRKTNGFARIVKTKEGEISISKSKHIKPLLSIHFHDFKNFKKYIKEYKDWKKQSQND